MPRQFTAVLSLCGDSVRWTISLDYLVKYRRDYQCSLDCRKNTKNIKDRIETGLRQTLVKKG